MRYVTWRVVKSPAVKKLIALFLASLGVFSQLPASANALRPIIHTPPEVNARLDQESVTLSSRIEDGKVTYFGSFHLYLDTPASRVGLALEVSDLIRNFEQTQYAIPLERTHPIRVIPAASATDEIALPFLKGSSLRVTPGVPIPTVETVTGTLSVPDGEPYRDSLFFELRWQQPAGELLPAGEYGGYVVIHVATVY